MSKTKKYALIAILSTVVLMVIFSFTDLAIAKIMYHPDSLFGKVFAIIGQMCSPILSSMSLAILMLCRKRDHAGAWIALVVFGLLYVGMCGLAGFVGVSMFAPDNMVLVAIIAVSTMLVTLVFALGVKPENFTKWRQFAWIFWITATLSALCINLFLKGTWGRARFYEMVAANNFELFTPWFLPQFDRFVGVVKDPTSFPSGHAADAANMFALVLLPGLFPRLENKRKLFWAIAWVWTALVMLDRMVMGWHFASDVVIGAVVTLVILYIVSRLVGKQYNKLGAAAKTRKGVAK